MVLELGIASKVFVAEAGKERELVFGLSEANAGTPCVISDKDQRFTNSSEKKNSRIKKSSLGPNTTTLIVLPHLGHVYKVKKKKIKKKKKKKSNAFSIYLKDQISSKINQ